MWLLLATLIRWGLRGVLAKRGAKILWATSLLASGGVLAGAALTLLRVAPVGEQAPPEIQGTPPAQSSLPSIGPPRTLPPGPAAQPPPPVRWVSPTPSRSPPPPESGSGGTAGGAGPAAHGAASSYPQFPWPPPPPSAETVVPNAVLLSGLRQPSRLADIAQVLVNALQNAGYYQNVYYEAPNGFALVARLERIYRDGSSYQGLARFDSSFSPLPAFSLSGYLRALFQAPTGYYRVIVFIISNTPFAADGKAISSSEADLWLERGANALPVRIADIRYTDTYTCTALIYEFEKHDAQSDPTEDRPGPLSADAHLIKARIAETLRWPLH